MLNKPTNDHLLTILIWPAAPRSSPIQFMPATYAGLPRSVSDGTEGPSRCTCPSLHDYHRTGSTCIIIVCGGIGCLAICACARQPSTMELLARAQDLQDWRSTARPQLTSPTPTSPTPTLGHNNPDPPPPLRQQGAPASWPTTAQLLKAWATPRPPRQSREHVGALFFEDIAKLPVVKVCHVILFSCPFVFVSNI